MIERVLIVGHGSIGKRHLSLAREFFPSADIRIFRHQPTDSIPELSNGCIYSIENAMEFSPQIAVIANPASFHIQTANALAEAKVSLLVEKPLSTSCDGVNELLEKSLKNNVTLLVGYNLRFLPSLQRFRSFIGDNIIGRVLSVRCEIGQYLPSWRPGTDYRVGVSAQKKLGGGALLELSHEIDYLRWIFGEVDWVKSIMSHQSDLEIDVEDTVHAILGFSKWDSGHQLIARLDMDFIRHDSTRQCIAIGELGSLRWNGLAGTVELFSKESQNWQTIFEYKHQRNDSYRAEWRHFIDCFENAATPLITGYDGLMVMKIIDAIRLSSQSSSQCFVDHVSRLNIL